MCGVLLVQSRNHMPLHMHSAALQLLARRGPDQIRYQWPNASTFVAHSVLHITGSDLFYQQQQVGAFAYNGEIYDYRRHGNFDNDIELAYHHAKTNPMMLKHTQGTWAWIYADESQCMWASDPQGEKSLYMYQDSDLMIVSSDVAVILTYIKGTLQPVPYNNKCWTMIDRTPWVGIYRCAPGTLYVNGFAASQIDSIWDWVKPSKMQSFDEAYEEFVSIWSQTMLQIQSPKHANLSFSGGLDSSILMHSMPDLTPTVIDIQGKDTIVDTLPSQHKITVDYQTWAMHYREIIFNTKMPCQSWSHVGKWLVAKHSKGPVIFTGVGADELFGGYSHHQTLTADAANAVSPYCLEDHNLLWNRCVEVYHGDARQASLLMDYWYQVVGLDAPGLDRLGGYWGKETRNPFLVPSIIKFAFGLPWHIKVGTGGKLLLRRLYHELTGRPYELPKMGFAGHANDALPWLGVNISTTGNRHIDWQQIAQTTFYEYCAT